MASCGSACRPGVNESDTNANLRHRPPSTVDPRSTRGRLAADLGPHPLRYRRSWARSTWIRGPWVSVGPASLDSGTSYWHDSGMTPTPDDARYSLTELADLAGVTPRTVRYYLASGLLPAVGVSGPGAKYGDDHLDRLRVIRRLQREHLPLAEIRRRLAELDGATIHDLAGTEAPATPGDSALEYIRGVLGVASSGISGGQPRTPSLMRFMRSVPAPLTGPFAESPRFKTVAIPPPTAPAHATAEPPAEYHSTPTNAERSQWERIVLAPDVELHVRRPSSRIKNKGIERLVTIARELLEED
jgi:DNA-binding transcriptional MerR regulator